MGVLLQQRSERNVVRGRFADAYQSKPRPISIFPAFGHRDSDSSRADPLLREQRGVNNPMQLASKGAGGGFRA